MRVFLFEYASAGGAWDRWHQPDLVRELQPEGHAMCGALAQDLMDAGCEVQVAFTASDENERHRCFRSMANASDATILIAPEIGGILLQLAREVESLGGRLLSPSSELVAVASNKHTTAQRLHAAQVRAPRGILQPAGTIQRVPWNALSVCKPCDGAGSWQVQPFEQWIGPLDYDARLEPFCAGTPASVALLCGPQQIVPLEPCYQHLGGASGLEYRGGSLPLPGALAARARSLASQAIQALPAATGYVGVDLILGDPSDGSEDVVIEINPRLTTSYIGLRKAYSQNLAEAWIRIASSDSIQLSIPQIELEFSAEGPVIRHS